ncbi:macrolide 2'-phosphotransferase [Aerococcaceae bacterium 50-4]
MQTEKIVDLATKFGIHLMNDAVQPVNMGLDFQVVLGQDVEKQAWVLRVPRRDEVFEKAKLEKAILDLVNQHVSTVEVPNWTVFDRQLIAYKSLAGTPAVTTDMETYENHWLFDVENVPTTYTRSLAEALVAIHQMPVANVEEIGIKRQTAAELRANMQARIDAVKAKYTVHQSLLNRWETWLNDESLWPNQVGFYHGDLFPGHILLAENHKVSGIIDWTEAQVGDVANDFTAHFLLFGEQALADLIQAYKQAGGYTWPKMKEHIIELLSIQPITIAEFAESSGNEDYAKAAADMLEKG